MFIGRPMGHENNRERRDGNGRIKVIADQWRDLFLLHRDALGVVARILTDGPCSPAVILLNAESRIKDTVVRGEFQYAYAIRMVVLTALMMPSLDQCAEGIELFGFRTGEVDEFEDRMAALPFRERCVIFLRDVLKYSRRDTALLLNTGDSHVDDLLFFARERLALEGPAQFDMAKRYFSIGAALPWKDMVDDALLGCA